MKKLPILSLCLILISTTYSIRLNAQSWTQVGSGINGKVLCMAEYNGELYIGGHFTIAGGLVVSNIVRWNGTDYFTVGAGVGDGGVVNSMCVYNGELYVVGELYFGGVPVPKDIAKWDGANWISNLTITNGNTNWGGQWAVCNPLVVFNNKLIIGQAGVLLAWDGITLDTIPSLYNCFQLGVFNSNLHAVGEVYGVNDYNLMKWDGINWTDIQGLTTGNVSIEDIQEYNNELYVTGTFASMGGIAITHNIAKWNGSTWSNVVLPSQGEGSSMCVYNNVLYLAGNQSVLVNNVYCQGVLRFDGSNWSYLGINGISGGAHTVIGYNNNIYAAGEYQNLYWINPNVGVNDFIPESNIAVYPNPSSNTIYLQLPEKYQESNISIYSSTGKLVYTEKYSNQVDVSNFASGVYFLTIPTESGTLRKGFVVDKK